MQINVEFQGDTFVLSDEHAGAVSAYGSPVLIAPNGAAYGPWDVAITRRAKEPNLWGEYCKTEWTARSIARYIRDDHQHNPEALALLSKFEAVRA